MKSKGGSSGGYSRGYQDGYGDAGSDDMDAPPQQHRKKTPSLKGSNGGGAPKRPSPASQLPPMGGATSPVKNSRSRPTNNQLLYKAYFRWAHYSYKIKQGTNLPVETDACASVTAAFLQVLQILQNAEANRTGPGKRNILQILSSNTRRTKVVELSSGTHRVPEELKKHYLPDGEGGQYSTNLDRNRYGNDDNYLFTVIRYDLEFLGLCPCMVDVEIIDAKQGNQSTIVSAGNDVCTCQCGPPRVQVAPVQQEFPAPLPGPAPTLSAPLQLAPVHQIGAPGPLGLLGLPPDTHAHALFNPAQAFRPAHPHQMAAPVVPVNPNAGRESPKRSGTSASQLFDALVMAATGGGADGATAAGLGGEPPVTSPAHADQPNRPGPRNHGPPNRNKSKLWSVNMSFGDVDSLQNALDAFREQDEIASGEPFLGQDGGPQRSDSLRQRRRKPVRNSSVLGRPASSGGPGTALLGLVRKTSLREKSDDNLKLDPDSFAGPGAAGAAAGGAPACSLQSGEDDNDALAAKGEGMGEEEEEEQEVEAEAVAEADGEGMEGSEGLALAALRHHMRHVPRQSSVANLGPRVNAINAAAAGAGALDPKRMSQDIESLRQENRVLRQQLHRQVTPATSGGSGSGGDTRVRRLETDLMQLRQELMAMSQGKKQADEECNKLKRDLLASQQQLSLMLARMAALTQGGAAPVGALAPPSAAPNTAALSMALAGLLGPAVASQAAAAAAQAAAVSQAAQVQQANGTGLKQEPWALPGQPGLLQAAAGALDPSAFAAHFAALQGIRPPGPGQAQQTQVSLAGGNVLAALMAAKPAFSGTAPSANSDARRNGAASSAGAASSSALGDLAVRPGSVPPLAGVIGGGLGSGGGGAPGATTPMGGGAGHTTPGQGLGKRGLDALGEDAAFRSSPVAKRPAQGPPEAMTPSESGFSDVAQLLNSDAPGLQSLDQALDQATA